MGQAQAMAGFRRAFNAFPGYDILGAIESVNVIDVPPPSVPLGPGTGVVAVVAEFEDGVFNAPTRVFGGSDLGDKFGGFGFMKSGKLSQYPVARQSAGAGNPWEGNGFIQVRNKKFAGLVIVRVDNSSGTVRLRRLASITGGPGPYDLEPGQLVRFSVDAGPPADATFTGTAALLVGVGGTFDTGFVGGETLQVKVDQSATRTITFTAAHQTLAQVIAHVNATLGATVASNSGGQLALSSLVRGWSGRVEVVGGTGLAILGLPAAPVAEVYTINATAVGVAGAYTVRTTVTVNGAAVQIDGTWTSVGGEAAATVRNQVRNAVQTALAAAATPTGVTAATGGATDFTETGDPNVDFTVALAANPGAVLTLVHTNLGTFTVKYGTGNVANIDRVTLPEAAAVISAISDLDAGPDAAGNLRVVATATPLTGSLAVTFVTATALGLAVQTATAAGTVDVDVPPGTILSSPTTGAKWLTLERVTSKKGAAAALRPRVRPAVDDDTTPTSLTGTVTVLDDLLGAAFQVDNEADLARLGQFQMETRYATAIDSTINVSGVPFEINQIVSARPGVFINEKVANNAVVATTSGHRARKAVISPPIGTTREDAKATTGIGVGENRHERVIYAFPAMTTRIPEIAAVGAVLGGLGFTDDGVVEVTSNVFYASVRSVLPPEENAGQQLTDTNYGAMLALALENKYNPESGLDGAIGLTMEDYIDLKAKGIIGPRLDRTAGMVFQSDVTSVDPSVQPELSEAKRRYFGDFIIDGLMDIGVKYVKKLNTPSRRAAFISTVNAFLRVLQSPDQPETSRLEDFIVEDTTSPELRAKGFQILSVKVRMYASMDYVVFRTEVGTTVSVEQTA